MARFLWIPGSMNEICVLGSSATIDGIIRENFLLDLPIQIARGNASSRIYWLIEIPKLGDVPEDNQRRIGKKGTSLR